VSRYATQTRRYTTQTLSIGDAWFEVTYQYCPAEPDVGLDGDYLDIQSIKPLNPDHVVSAEVEDAIVDALLEELDP
jgi:hypothetical protein